jgi:hypothetical protein
MRVKQVGNGVLVNAASTVWKFFVDLDLQLLEGRGHAFVDDVENVEWNETFLKLFDLFECLNEKKQTKLLFKVANKKLK